VAEVVDLVLKKSVLQDAMASLGLVEMEPHWSFLEQDSEMLALLTSRLYPFASKTIMSPDFSSFFIAIKTKNRKTRAIWR
jgi:hypothetical protein